MLPVPTDRAMEGTLLRCRRCRRAAVDLTASPSAADESSADVCAVWHVSVDKLPGWILTSVQQAQWTAGKLNCCNCGARLGGFNFLTRSRCPCGLDTKVHLNKSRVDQDRKRHVPIVQPRRTRSEAGTETGQSEPSRTPLISRPAESSDRVPDGGTRQGRCCLEDDGHSADSTDLLRSFFLNPQLDPEDSIDPGVPGVSGARRLSQYQNQDQTHEAQEPTPGHEEVLASGSSVRWRSSSDGEALQESSSAEIRLNKREKNRLKSQRRKERRRERWLQCLDQQKADGAPPADPAVGDGDGLTCPVCLDVYFSPHACQPCGHVFCEPCLRTLAQNRLTVTPCPLCRTLISNTSFSEELDQTAKALFPTVYFSRKHSFQHASCSRWPLPNAKKPFGSFWENRRPGAPVWRRWHFVHRGLTPEAVYVNNARDLQLNLGLVLVHVSPFYWILALKVLCVLLYYFVF
ncbi:E3 ubiquitin-protein ligase RNF180 [Nematolebias whitei]|uniref:E3 ubiquitin-protein ligase RNF180 n=1 Tax=Nematolebias whitei TaxID=451745 RepID=UPI00189AF027|nr:E3 ubiquitin-protein ligase RNF180 [Nematolebias whitei]